MESVLERWRDVIGYEGWYEVSDLGRVRTVKTGRILRQVKTTAYLKVTLSLLGEQRRHKVHRLVAEAFGGIDPDQDAHHIDGDGRNNAVSNLAKMSQDDHAVAHDRHPGSMSGHCGLGSHRCKACRRIVRRRYYERKGK